MTAWYVFGVVPAGSAAPVGVTLVEEGGLAAVAAEVPLSEFGEDVLPQRLEDRGWLEEKARTHESVLRTFVGSVPVVPLRFGAIYADLDAVRRMLASRRRFFEQTLAAIDGNVEVGVKAWFDPATVARPAVSGGRAYLERRRGELDARRSAGAAAARAHERLARAAVGAVANRPQPRELTGRSEEMLLNGAYLVPRDHARFLREVEALAAELAAVGVALETTGPWPAYNFAREEDEAA